MRNVILRKNIIQKSCENKFYKKPHVLFRNYDFCFKMIEFCSSKFYNNHETKQQYTRKTVLKCTRLFLCSYDV